MMERSQFGEVHREKSGTKLVIYVLIMLCYDLQNTNLHYLCKKYSSGRRVYRVIKGKQVFTFILYKVIYSYQIFNANSLWFCCLIRN